MAKKLHALLSELGIDFSGLSNPLIENICCDSRLVKQGDLFFGLPGRNFDGSSFWAEALAKGAAAVVLSSSSNVLIPESQKNLIIFVQDPVAYWMGELASLFWDKPSLKLKLIGVTGTNGKTTTTHLIEHLSKISGSESCLFGTLFNRWPNYSEVAMQTTRFSNVLHEQLAQAIRAGVKSGAMEVSSHALDQHRVSGLRFAGAIFTNLSQDHLDYHGSMDLYFETKARLFEEPLLISGSARSVVNIDNEWGSLLAGRLQDRCWRSSLDDNKINNENPELYMKDIQVSGKEVSGVIRTPLGEGFFKSSLMGKFNLMNLLQAIGSLIQLGYPLEQLLERVKDFPGVPGRMELVSLPKLTNECEVPKVLVDYAHTPDGLKNALLASRPFVQGKLICVFGCGGDRDRGKRGQMGAIAYELADKIIITSDNPRTEDPNEIIRDIVSDITTFDDVIIEVDRKNAIEIAVSMAKLTDLVLIAGKGHEDYQIIGNNKKYFDDREVTRRALQKKFYD